MEAIESDLGRYSTCRQTGGFEMPINVIFTCKVVPPSCRL